MKGSLRFSSVSPKWFSTFRAKEENLNLLATEYRTLVLQSVSFAKRISHSADKVLRGGHDVLPVPGAAFLKEEAVGLSVLPSGRDGL